MVPQSEVLQNKVGSDDVFRPLYSEGKEAAVSTFANLAEEAKLASAEVNAPGQAILSVCKSLIAGGVAGGVSRTAVAPLERLKILLQVQNPLNPKYNGMVQGLRYIWNTEGVRGFFKGNGTNCARIIPNSAVKFYSYEQASSAILWLYRRETGNEDAEHTPVTRLGAGACAGIIAMSATYPMDMVRGRLTVQTENSPHQYRGMFHALSTVLREEGPKALYKGWLPSVIGVIPYVGLNFAVYESLKDWMIKNRTFGLSESSELTVMTKLACGAAAGTVGQTVAYPLDVIRRRMQMGGWKDAASIVTGDGARKSPVHYSGMIDAFSQTVRNEGVGALYRGLVPNSVKVGVACMWSFCGCMQAHASHFDGGEEREGGSANSGTRMWSKSIVDVHMQSGALIPRRMNEWHACLSCMLS